jgi:hypothetical protein
MLRGYCAPARHVEGYFIESSMAPCFAVAAGIAWRYVSLRAGWRSPIGWTCMMSYFASPKYGRTWLRPARLAIASLAAVITAGDHTGAANGRNERAVAFVESR